MADEFIGLTREDANRLGDMLDWYDSTNPSNNYRPRKPARQPVVLVPRMVVVLVTSITTTSHLYPATFELEVDLTASPPSFSAISGTCWAVEPNGFSLFKQKYIGKASYNYTDGNPIVEVVATGGPMLARLSSGTGPSYSFVQQTEISGGTTADTSGGVTGTCYDLNGGTGLPTGAAGTGQNVWLYPMPSGDWAFILGVKFSGTESVCLGDGNLHTWKIACGFTVSIS